ncbi:MAG TPA: hypothetical protein VMR46_02035 [Candidatus Paceibacterota bacterium]|nr:hypothetical protein [Candidatus Paceibacterota bacterium]
MVIQTWVQVLQQSFYNLLWGVVSFIPNFVFAVIIFLIGWFVGVLLGRVVDEAIKAIRVDHALRAAGVEDVMHRAGYKLNSGAFMGALVKWFVIIVFLMASLQLLGLAQVTFFLQQIVLSFLPQVIVAVLVLLVAAVVAEVAQGVVAGAARAAGIRSAGFAGTVAKWAIWGFAIIVALSQIGIATAYFQTLFTGLVVALSLAFGLAFGLGGQETAARFLEKTREGMSNRL